MRREIGRYTTMLSGLRLTDADVIAPTNPARLLRSAFGIAVLVVVLGGVVAATAFINIWPAGLVALASLLVKTPVSKGTARVLVGLLAFPTAWITAGVLATDGAVRVTPRGAHRRGRGARRDLARGAGDGPGPDAAPLAGAARADRHGRPRRRRCAPRSSDVVRAAGGPS